MPYSQSIQNCFHCGTQYISGDSIENRCGSCRRKGHSIQSHTCAICNGDEKEGKDPLADLDTIIRTMKRRQG